jgi:hypothetical protein
MKKIITLCLVAFGLVSVQAQVDNFAMTPDTLVVIGTNVDDGLKVDIEVKNKANKDRLMVWERIIVKITEGWETSICDPVTCWSALKSSSEFNLPANGAGGMVLDAFPNGLVGGAYVKIKVYEKALPAKISTGRYRFNGTVVGVAEVEATKLSVFPNPTADYFVLQGAAPLTTVDVLSVTGQVLRTFPYVENEIYEIQDLAAGTYFLNLNGENNKRLATKRIVKR